MSEGQRKRSRGFWHSGTTPTDFLWPAEGVPEGVSQCP